LKKGFTRRIDLSTGVAKWLVSSNEAGAAYRKTASIRAGAVPPAWQVELKGARWIQPTEQGTPQIAGSMPSSFLMHFNVIKGPGEMRVVLKGRAVGDEGFAVELIDPEPVTSIQGGLPSERPEEGAPRLKDVKAFEFVAGETSGSKNPRPGVWELAITVENAGKGDAATVGLLAQVELVQTCLNWGRGKKKRRRR
jgi:hypothetical protein